MARRGVGRPERSYVEKARDATWMHSCLVEAKCKTVVAFAALFPAEAGLPSLSVLHKYKRGDAGPSDATLAIVHRKFPTAERTFRHPVWDLAAARAITPGQLVGLIRQLPPDLRDEWLMADGRLPFWRSPDADLGRLAIRALKRPSLSSAAFALAAVHDAQLRQAQQEHFIAWQLWARIGTRLIKEMPHLSQFFGRTLRQLRPANYTEGRPLRALNGALESADGRARTRASALTRPDPIEPLLPEAEGDDRRDSAFLKAVADETSILESFFQE